MRMFMGLLFDFFNPLSVLSLPGLLIIGAICCAICCVIGWCGLFGFRGFRTFDEDA